MQALNLMEVEERHLWTPTIKIRDPLRTLIQLDMVTRDIPWSLIRFFLKYIKISFFQFFHILPILNDFALKCNNCRNWIKPQNNIHCWWGRTKSRQRTCLWFLVWSRCDPFFFWVSFVCLAFQSVVKMAFLRSPLLCSTWSWLSAATVTCCGIWLDQTASHLRPGWWCVGSKRLIEVAELADLYMHRLVNYCIGVFVWPLFFQILTRGCHISWNK